MTPLEKVQSMKMPFAELKGITFVEATLDRVVARMVVRPDLCTTWNTIHGGAVMAFADSVGAAATGHQSAGRRQGDDDTRKQDQLHRTGKGGDNGYRHGDAGASRPPHPGLDH